MSQSSKIQFALPKGRMYESIIQLLADAGIKLTTSERGYRPSLSLDEVDTKILKPQNIIEMLDLGSRDVGFAGADWVEELGADVVEILDTGLDRVQIVVAASQSVMNDGQLDNTALRVASEYERLTRQWLEKSNRTDTFIRSFGSTEVFPPEDADYVIDISATGSTLRANQLSVIEVIGESSTRLYASRKAMGDPEKRKWIEDLRMVLDSVLLARKRVMVEANVESACLDAIMAIFPAMKQPTVSELAGNQGYAVKAAVERDQIFQLIPSLKHAGASDIVITNISKVVR
ncbi:MAG: ATP phosphoribosyltransferase [Fimbriimonadaceae bacterium]